MVQLSHGSKTKFEKQLDYYEAETFLAWYQSLFCEISIFKIFLYECDSFIS